MYWPRDGEINTPGPRYSVWFNWRPPGFISHKFMITITIIEIILEVQFTQWYLGSHILIIYFFLIIYKYIYIFWGGGGRAISKIWGYKGGHPFLIKRQAGGILFYWRRIDRVPNATIYSLTESAPFIERVSLRQLRFLGHVLRLPENKAVRDFVMYFPSHGRKKPGRQQTLGILIIC